MDRASLLCQTFRQTFRVTLRASFAAVLTVAIVWLLARAVHVSPREAIGSLVGGAFGSRFAWTGTLIRATPIILTGLSVAWAFRAGLFNIGAEGQLLWGALAAGWAGAALHVPAPLAVLIGLAAGAAAGALWAWPAALLKCRMGTPEVVSTLLLSLVADFLTTYLATHPLHDPQQQGPRLREVAAQAQLPVILGGSVNLGLLLAIAAAVLLALVLHRTGGGFRLQVVGRSPEAARASNINVDRVWTAALLQSGALAGLAGAVQILGALHYFQARFSPGYGFEGIPVAILGMNHPLGVLAAALFWGALANGAVEMESAVGISRYLVAVIQALVVLLVAVRRWPDWMAVVRRLNKPAK